MALRHCVAAARRGGGAQLLSSTHQLGAARLSSSHQPAAAPLPLPAAAAASWDTTRALAERGAQRRATYENAPVSTVGAPPPEVSPAELASWEKRQGGTAHAFPDWIERWSRRSFYRAGAGLVAVAGATAAAFGPLSAPALAIAAPVAAYWAIGLRDINQTRHTARARC